MPKIETLCSYISLVDSEFKIAISCNRIGENVNQNTLDMYLKDKEKTPFDILTFLLDSTNSINREQNRNINSINKIKDKKSIARYISRNLRRITQSLGKELDLKTVQCALKQVLNTSTEEKAESSIKSDTKVQNFPFEQQLE